MPDLQTLRVASWLDKSALVICDVEDEKTHRLTAVAPRTLLRKQINQAAALGYTAKAAAEFEYYLFNNSYKEAHRRNFQNLEPAGWYIENYHMLQGSREEVFNAAVRRHLKQSGIPVENSKGGVGSGAARTQRALWSYPGNGGPARHLQAVPEGNRRQCEW